MASILGKFVNRIEFDSYEDFKENFKIIVPESFNFAYDVVDWYAQKHPRKEALVWCNDHGDERIINFKEMKEYSEKAANFFKECGIKKGDRVMLT